MPSLGVFVRHPLPGQVKTRLAATVGPELAARLYHAFVADTLDALRDVAARRYVCLTPADPPARHWCAALAKNDYTIWPQPAGLLGDRMQAFFADVLQSPAECAVIVGSDSPTLPKQRVQQALDLLEETDAVLGPATDGGYYLLGLRGQVWPVFSGIAWGGSMVLRQTVERLRHCGARCAVLPVWYDVDTIDDLRFLGAHLEALRLAGAVYPRQVAWTLSQVQWPQVLS
jgi:hypothetical protein